MAHPGGRPTAYKPEYCEQLINHMANGLSFESFAGLLGVSNKTLYNWTKLSEEFLQAKEIGFEKSRLFWEKLGVAGAAGRVQNFNASAFIFNMKNRFKTQWRDRHELDVTGTVEHEHTHEVAALVNELKDVIQLPNAPKRLPILEVLEGDGT